MSSQPKYFEPKRGCGYREVGKLYLMGPDTGYHCPSLPLLFKPCKCCGYEPPQYRDFQWVNKSYIRGELWEPTGQACNPKCPVCYPGTNSLSRYGLMWVGRKFYTPQEFLEEMADQEVSKAIKQIPKGLVLGETWVMLAHPEAYVDSSDDEYIQLHGDWVVECSRLKMDDEKPPEPRAPTYPGVISAFIPSRIEMLVYQADVSPEYVLELEAKGITVIVVPDKYDGHRRKTRKTRGRRNIA